MVTHDFIRDIRINQNKDGYRFSVDALLVASFVNQPRAKRIADLGAGSGIIGLLLARQFPGAEVTLIELQESLAKRAEENIAMNGLEDRVRVITSDVRDITRRITEIYCLRSRTGKKDHSFPDSSGFEGMMEHFDLLVSNPPFRKMKTGLLSLGDERLIARHEVKLPLADLIKASSMMLKHHGRFCMIHLPERLADIARAMSECAMEPKRLRFVHSNAISEAKMVLIEAVKGGRTGIKTERPLFIYNEDGSYTKEMKEYYSSGAV
ncbi:MAG TPA: tRNA1(Val) (adenine(37)-N6)-methyltransferase [Dissulfurispiraceae bacterium]